MITLLWQGLHHRQAFKRGTAGAPTGLARMPCIWVCRACCTADICSVCSIQGYKQVCGFADVWGDGIIPLESAHLDGAQGDLFWLKH